MSLQFLNTSTINRLPLNPSLEQLRNQAKDLLKAYVAGESEALKTFDEFHPQGPPPNLFWLGLIPFPVGPVSDCLWN